MRNDRFLTYPQTSTGGLRLGFRSSRGLDQGAHRQYLHAGTPRDKSPAGHWNIGMFRAIWSSAMQRLSCPLAYSPYAFTRAVDFLKLADAAR
jgi:hypothetical protein